MNRSVNIPLDPYRPDQRSPAAGPDTEKVVTDGQTVAHSRPIGIQARSESKMHFSEEDPHAHISVIGNVTNSSEITWEDIHFEAQFFDSAGKLIDVITDTDYALVIQANGQSVFRVRGRADKPKELYDHFEIQIKKARESNKLF